MLNADLKYPRGPIAYTLTNISTKNRVVNVISVISKKNKQMLNILNSAIKYQRMLFSHALNLLSICVRFPSVFVGLPRIEMMRNDHLLSPNTGNKLFLSGRNDAQQTAYL